MRARVCVHACVRASVCVAIYNRAATVANVRSRVVYVTFDFPSTRIVPSKRNIIVFGQIVCQGNQNRNCFCADLWGVLLCGSAVNDSGTIDNTEGWRLVLAPCEYLIGGMEG